MSSHRLKEVVVIVAIVLATTSLAFVFLGRNLHWLEGAGGVIVSWMVALGLLVSFAGGIGLAAARKNPLWLLATVSALCAGYVWILVASGMAMGRMH